ncbi:vesicle transport protein GOT1 isoform X2 [Manihot esculenta]|nr:vesicle transport protein GOT1 isoform X2 [Manihot esculenta]
MILTLIDLKFLKWNSVGQCMVVMGIFFSSMGIFCGCCDVCLVIGNILFILGFCLTFGLKFSIQFFMQRQNFKGTVSFGAGFYFITIGWPIFGVILEAYGFIILFSFFWPALAVFPEKIPILGWVFRQPFVRLFFDTYQGKRCQCDSGILSNAWEL